MAIPDFVCFVSFPCLPHPTPPHFREAESGSTTIFTPLSRAGRMQLEQLQQTEQLQLELLVSLLLIYDLRCMCASIRPILCRSLAAAAEADVAAAARTTVDARVADAAVLLCVAPSTAACWPRARLQARQRRRPRGSRAPSRGQVNPPSPPLYISFAILHTKQTGGDG